MNWGLLQNSLIVAGASATCASTLGIAFALFAAGLGPRSRSLTIWLAGAALVIPPFLVTNTWLHFFGLNGVWRPLLDFNLYSLWGTVLLLALLLWPISFLINIGAVLRMDRLYLEQEPLLRGAALLRYLVWPACAASAGFSWIATFVLALNNFTVPALLQTKVYAAEVWLSFNTRFDYIEALRVSWPLIAGPFLLLILFRFTRTRLVFKNENFAAALWRKRMGSLFPACAVVGIGALVLSLAFPLSQLLSAERTWTEFVPAIAAGKSALFNTAFFASASAVLVTVLGIVAARFTAGLTGWLPFLAPGVLLGIALIWIFNRPMTTAFYQSAGIVLLAFTIRYFALGWSGARAARAVADPALADVVSIFGGSRWARFRLAEWPASKTVLLGTFYVVYLLCLWEVETLVLIVPPGRETLALRAFNMLHYGHAGQVNALCLWLILLGIAPLALYSITRFSLRKFGSLAVVPLLFAGCGSKDESTVKLRSDLFSSVQVFGNRGTGVGQFNKPRSIAVDRDDNFYVVDLTGRVQKFSPDGRYLLAWQMPQTDKGKPKGMICDHEGNIIVVEPHYSRANHYTPEGKLAWQWGENGTNQGQLYFPRAAAINSHGEIFLSEYGFVERVQQFAARGTNFIMAIGAAGTAPGEFNRAEGIGIGPDDSLFVADSCNHRVQIISPGGKLAGTFGSAGSGKGEMSYPYDVRVDPLGYRFVCEFGNSRVQVFDAQNRSVEIVGGAGAEPGRMNNPWAIALDSQGNLYVADSLNHRVQKFIRREPLEPAHTRLSDTPRVALR